MAVDLRAVRLIAKHQRRRHDPHDVRSHELGLRNQGIHFAPGHFVATGLQTVGMSPSQDPFQAFLVEYRLDVRQIIRFQALEETRLQRYAVDAQRSGALDEVLERPTQAGVLLIRIDFPEVAVVAVAVDADFHVQISSTLRPNTLPRN